MCRWEQGRISFSVQLFNNKGASWVISGECDDASWMWCLTPGEILLPYQIVVWFESFGRWSRVDRGSRMLQPRARYCDESRPWRSVAGDNHDDMIVPGSQYVSPLLLEKPEWVADGLSNDISKKILKTAHRLLQLLHRWEAIQGSKLSNKYLLGYKL